MSHTTTEWDTCSIERGLSAKYIRKEHNKNLGGSSQRSIDVSREATQDGV